MNSRQMRDEFEAWWEPHGYPMMTDGETYYDRITHFAWISWKASRESLVVELPSRMLSVFGDSYGYNDALIDCEKAIHAAGVRTK